MAYPNNGRRVTRREPVDIIPTRLDLKTRICLMAATIIATDENQDATKAVEAALAIEDIAEQKIKELKSRRPIPRSDYYE